MEPKFWLDSKTIWAQIFAAITAGTSAFLIIFPELMEVVNQLSPIGVSDAIVSKITAYLVLAMIVSNLYLRFVTDRPITLSRDP